MNYRKAAAELRHQLYEEGHCTYIEHELVMAIKALEIMPEYEKLKERDKAKRPSCVDDSMGCFMCANCGGEIYYSGEKESHEFCLICGQRIDWSEEVADEET